MAQVVVIRYRDGRYHDIETSNQIILRDIAEMSRAGREYLVYDAKNGDDITKDALAAALAEEQQNGPASRVVAAKDLAKHLEVEFRQGTSDAIREAHRAQIPVPILGDDGGIAWLHPDGVVRPTRDMVRIDDRG